MPAPMSLDLRRRIVRAVEGGSSIRAAARRFAVSPSAAIKLMQRVRATGSVALARFGGQRGRCSRRMRPNMDPVDLRAEVVSCVIERASALPVDLHIHGEGRIGHRLNELDFSIECC